MWGYAHYAVFAGIAAFGAGLQVAVTTAEARDSISDVVAAMAVALPVAVYLVVTSLLHAQFSSDWHLRRRHVAVVVALLVGAGLAARWIPIGLDVPLLGALTAGLVAYDALSTRRASPPSPTGSATASDA